jgi:hypothetical protein
MVEGYTEFNSGGIEKKITETTYRHAYYTD